MKRLLAILFATMFAGQAVAYLNVYDFSAVCASGQTLYYKITGSTVQVTFPHCGESGYFFVGYVGDTKPTGNLVIPESVVRNSTKYKVTSIRDNAFFECSGLTSVTIPNSVKSIGAGAFQGCSSLTSITLPFVGDKEHSSADTYQYPFGYIFGSPTSGGILQSYYGSSTSSTTSTRYAIPTSLRDVILTGSNYIPYGAFYNCSNLTTITIPNSVCTIGNKAFYGCDNLDYTLNKNGKYLGNGENPYYVLWEPKSSNFTEFELNNKCKLIAGGALANCEIETVNIQYCKNIGEAAFSNCKKLTSLILGDSVISIESKSFSGCTSLVSIIMDTVENIGVNAFSGCTKLTSIIIPESVKSIGENAFNIINLTSVICMGKTPAVLESDPFPNNETIYVPKTSIDDYVTASIWKRKEILPWYTITATSDNELFGTVENIGYCGEGCNATVKAIPAEGYHFAGWSDGNNDIVRIITVTENVTLTATFGAHVSVTDAAVDATCETIGLTEGSHCSICGKVFVEQTEIPATGHTEIVDAAVAATCTETGLTEGKHCSVCNAILVAQETTDALGHTEVVDAAIAATCTETGLTAGKHCLVCNAILVAQETTDALGHTEVVDAAVDATCETIGLTEGSHCSICGKVFVEQTEIPATGHTEVVDAAVAATCTETGLTEGKHCSVCNAILVAQETTAALGHTEVVDAAVAATCTETGLTEGKHCSVCNEILVAQETIEALGHTEVVDAAVAATCTESGLTEGKHCSVCNENLVAQDTIAALGHTEVVDAAVAATCTESGLTEGKHCSVCNVILVVQDTIAALGHTEVVDAAAAATCTESGKTEGKHCSICNTIFVAQEEIPALGHEFKNYVYNNDATTEADGTETAVCEHGCGATNTRVKEGTKLATTAVSESAVENFVVYAVGNTIVVENATEEIRVYDAMGKLVGRNAINRDRTEIPVKGAGVYIVKTGGVVKRVMVN